MQEATEVGTTHLGALVGCAPLGAPPHMLLWPILSVLVHKNSPKSFRVFGLRLVLISCDVKNKKKTTTGTWHYVNRLVPKNDIKVYNKAH